MSSLLNTHEIIFPQDAGFTYVAEETGDTFFENAYIKARTVYDRVHAPVIADDSGLCIDALNGAPGIFSARYGAAAGGVPSTAAGIEKVLAEMNGIQDRQCRFICCIVLMFNEHEFYSVQKAFEGEITQREQGLGGFGYDPIVYIPHLNKTVAELTPEEKNTYSHRGLAVHAVNQYLSHN